MWKIGLESLPNSTELVVPSEKAESFQGFQDLLNLMKPLLSRDWFSQRLSEQRFILELLIAVQFPDQIVDVQAVLSQPASYFEGSNLWESISLIIKFYPD